MHRVWATPIGGCILCTIKMTYRAAWFGDESESEDEQVSSDDEREVHTREVPRWQCYTDVDKRYSQGGNWTTEKFTVTCMGGMHNGERDGLLVTLDCNCGGDGSYDGGICAHRYRLEWCDRASAGQLRDDDPSHWEVQYHD